MPISVWLVMRSISPGIIRYMLLPMMAPMSIPCKSPIIYVWHFSSLTPGRPARKPPVTPRMPYNMIVGSPAIHRIACEPAPKPPRHRPRHWLKHPYSSPAQILNQTATCAMQPNGDVEDVAHASNGARHVDDFRRK